MIPAVLRILHEVVVIAHIHSRLTFSLNHSVSTALHVALLYLWQLDLLRLDSLESVARAAGLWVLTPDMPASQIMLQVEYIPYNSPSFCLHKWRMM